MFQYKNESWELTGDRTSTHVYAKRPGKKGRPSKFTIDELTAAGVALPEVGTQVPLPEPDVTLQDTPVVNEDVTTPVTPSEPVNLLIELF